MRSWGLKLVAPALVTIGALSFACGSMGDESAFADRNGGGPGAESPSGSINDNKGTGAGAAPELVPTDNGVIMVHAAGMPAFRLCFGNELDRLPAPDRQTMPDANVVGVEVGTAVRIAPLKGPPGKIYIFDEPLIRDFAGQGSTCEALLNNPTIAKSAREMPAVDTDYSHGVHLLVVRGCQAKTLTTYTKAECGEDYEDATGNLSILDTELKGANRTGSDLPTQVIHLSQAIEGSRNGATLSVSFGDVTKTDSAHTSIASSPQVFGPPLALQQAPAFDGTDESIYAKVGFRVTLTNGANAPVVVTQQSLAAVQDLSAPREVPTTYYSAASNYVLLLLGNPSPKLADGGPDTDPRHSVHLLAVPVIDPKADGGADAATATDGGAAPDGAK